MAGTCELWVEPEELPDLCNEIDGGSGPGDPDSPVEDGCGCDDPVAAKERACRLASTILYWLSGSRWSGLCDAVVRPCARASDCGLPAWPRRGSWPVDMVGNPIGWAWNRTWGMCSCGCAAECSCTRADRISLGRWPIDPESVVVKINGTPFTAFTVRGRRWLVRTDGHHWPSCQDPWLPDTEDHTFSVAFTYGRAIPDDARDIALLYATEIAKASCGIECNLPSRVASIVRQGTIVNFESASQLAEDGKTGVSIVDTWLGAANGGRKARTPLAIMSPDIPRATW